MPTVEASGSQLADGTEQTLATIITNRSLVLRVDISPLGVGQMLILRVKSRVLTGGGDRLGWGQVFVGQGNLEEELVQSIPVSSPHQAVFTLQQFPAAFGTFPWSVDSL